jgi:uncharacterized membrane protein YphA (DoxX/SURF4 family)
VKFLGAVTSKRKINSGMTKYLPITIRIIVAIILIQTLQYKFTSHPESVYIFTKAGIEPVGRIGIGIAELFAGILLLIEKTAWLGSLLTMIIIGGAIVLHLTKLGIEIHDDGGVLFYTALLIFEMSAWITFTYKKENPFIGTHF